MFHTKYNLALKYTLLALKKKKITNIDNNDQTVEKILRNFLFKVQKNIQNTNAKVPSD